MVKNDTHEINFKLLEERVSQLIAHKRIFKLAHAPIFLLLAQKFYVEDEDISECHTDGGNDCGVDAIYIERHTEQPTIHIIQSKYHTSLRKSRTPFKASALERIVKFFEILKDPSHNLDKVVNGFLEQKILEIREVQKKGIPNFKVWLLSNGKSCVPHEISPLEKKLNQDGVSVEEFHLSEFIEFCINRRSRRKHHTFNARETGILEYGPTELQGIVGFISARELYDLLKDIRDEQKIDYSVFDMNVRGFLGSDTTINKEILRSALSKENLHFSSLNNGITIIGSSVKVDRLADRAKIQVTNMNIVNGAQTCSAIFDAMKDFYPNLERFDKLSVLFRIFATDNRNLINHIALSTNSQNRINPRDLKANNKEQYELEQKLLQFGIKYIRKRGDFGDSDDMAMEHLDAFKAGQIILSYIHRDPARAKRDSDSIFLDNYYKLFSNINIDKLVEGNRLFRLIEEKRNIISDEIRIRGASRTENNFVTYGSFHILALCGVLKTTHPNMDDEQLISESISIISKILKRSGMPAYYSFFRNPEVTKSMIESASQGELFETE